MKILVDPIIRLCQRLCLNKNTLLFLILLGTEEALQQKTGSATVLPLWGECIVLFPSVLNPLLLLPITPILLYFILYFYFNIPPSCSKYSLLDFFSNSPSCCSYHEIYISTLPP